MVVAQEHHVDRRQVFEAQPRRVIPSGPIHWAGLARIDQTGSVRMFRPAVWSSTVE